MSSHESKGASAPGLLSRARQACSDLIHAGSKAVDRAGVQWREAALHPLRPFPLTHVAGGATAGQTSQTGQSLGPQEALMLPDPYLDLGSAGLPQATLQCTQRFLKQLPSRMPSPEMRRQGHGQLVLEWHGNHARRFSVVIGPDGMLIYSARLGPKGRLDGAEPIGNHLSPILRHVIRQLQA